MPWLVFAAVVLWMTSPAEPLADETSSFVVKLGSDTLSVEQFTRTPTQVRGEYVVRTPRASHRTYTIDLDAQGQARRFEMIVRNLGGGPGRAETRSTIDFTAQRLLQPLGIVIIAQTADRQGDFGHGYTIAGFFDTGNDLF